MIALIIGSITAIVLISVVTYTVYKKFVDIDSNLGKIHDTDQAMSKYNKKVFQELRTTDGELKYTGDELNTKLTTAQKVLSENITKTNTTMQERFTKSDKTLQENVTSLKKVDDETKKLVDKNMTTVQSEQKVMSESISKLKNDLDMTHKNFVTKFMGADALVANWAFMPSFLSMWGAMGSLYANMVYSQKLATTGVQVYDEMFNARNAKEVYHVDNKGNSWNKGNVKAESVTAENIMVYTKNDPNLGVNVFSTGKDGNTYAAYNGGLESWYGLGFRSKLDGNTSLIHDTRSGDTSIKGKLTTTKGVSVTNNDPGPMLEKNYGKNSDRYGVGQFPTGSMRMYTASAFGPASVSLSLAKDDGSFDDVVKVGTDKTAVVNGKLVAQQGIWGAPSQDISIFNQAGKAGATVKQDGSFSTNNMNFTSAWQSTPDKANNVSEISNDTGNFKTLMIVGNKSAGAERRVGVWDRLEVNGFLQGKGDANFTGNTRMSSVGRDSGDWFRIYGTPANGTAVYNGMSINDNGGLCVGGWDKVPQGELRVKNKDGTLTQLNVGGTSKNTVSGDTTFNNNVTLKAGQLCMGGTCINEANLKKVLTL